VDRRCDGPPPSTGGTEGFRYIETIAILHSTVYDKVRGGEGRALTKRNNAGPPLQRFADPSATRKLKSPSVVRDGRGIGVGSGALNPKQASSPGAAIGAVSAHPDAPAMQRVIAGGTAPSPVDPQRSANMARIGQRNTAPELAVRPTIALSSWSGCILPSRAPYCEHGT